jgi:hypothetical protein
LKIVKVREQKMSVQMKLEIFSQFYVENSILIINCIQKPSLSMLLGTGVGGELHEYRFCL